MNPGDTFVHNNGMVHTVLDVREPDMLVSYDTERGRYYAIAWGLHPLENGRYVWNQGHYYMKDLAKARRAMVTRERERNRPNPTPFIRSR